MAFSYCRERDAHPQYGRVRCLHPQHNDLQTQPQNIASHQEPLDQRQEMSCCHLQEQQQQRNFYGGHAQQDRCVAEEHPSYVYCYEDLLPQMVDNLGMEGLMRELAKGFWLLADPSTHTITLPSLRQAAPVLGLGTMCDSDLLDMMRLGGSHNHQLSLHQFCVAVLRSSPSLLQRSLQLLLEEEEEGGASAAAEEEEDNVSCLQ